MTEQLRTGILAARPAEVLEGVVECDEVYVTAGHKGQPVAVAKKTRAAKLAVGRRAVRGRRGRRQDCGGSGSAGPWRFGAVSSGLGYRAIWQDRPPPGPGR